MSKISAGLALAGGAAIAVWYLFARRKKGDSDDDVHEAPTITSFNDLEWHNGEPGGAGSWSVDKQGQLMVFPEPELDYWSRTFYSPPMIKHDAHTFLTTVGSHAEATLTTAFTLAPREQFDQAGVMVLVDEHTWVKAGIEYTDGVPRLSCVVTNHGFSDWSTQLWGHWDSAAQTTSVRIRVTKLLPGHVQGPGLVMEAAEFQPGDTVESNANWVQVRIASLRSGNRPWRMGFFAISPIAQKGGKATFHHMKLGPKVDPVHKTDPKHTDKSKP